MVEVPRATPQTRPVPEPAVAIAVLLLLQVPPAMASDSVVQEPRHMRVLPVIAEGTGTTVTVVVV